MKKTNVKRHVRRTKKGRVMVKKHNRRVKKRKHKMVDFRIKKDDWGEYQVQALNDDGEKIESRTYYTDDKKDAIDTMRLMKEEEKKHRREEEVLVAKSWDKDDFHLETFGPDSKEYEVREIDDENYKYGLFRKRKHKRHKYVDESKLNKKEKAILEQFDELMASDPDVGMFGASLEEATNELSTPEDLETWPKDMKVTKKDIRSVSKKIEDAMDDFWSDAGYMGEVSGIREVKRKK